MRSRIRIVLLTGMVIITAITNALAFELKKVGTVYASKTQPKSDSQLKAVSDTAMSKEKELVIFDFTKPGDQDLWRPINDTVMGGISASQLQPTKEGNALFAGNVSLENNGGFASVQSQPSLHKLDDFDGIAIRVKGDGKRYKLSLKNSAYMASPRYQSAFDTEKGVWRTIHIPFDTLVPTMHGRILENEPPLDVSKIVSIVLLVSDKQEGPFRLEIDWIKAYRN